MKRSSTRLLLEHLEDRTVLSSPGDIEWVRQFGSFLPGSAQWGAVDADGSAYLAGHVAGALPGQTAAGDFDCFVCKYDADGNELWTRQFGTTGRDSIQAVAADASGVYVAGYVRLALPGQTNIGGFDAFVRKYDAGGAIVWTRQFGTVANDGASSIAVDATGVYVGGFTEGIFGQSNFGVPNAFVRKYDANGGEAWTRQFASSSPIGGEDFAFHGARVSVSDAGVYVAWARFSQQTGSDVFVRRYDVNGAESWTRQFAADVVVNVAADASGVYMVGSTGARALPGQINLGGSDAFIRRYDAAGIEIWTRQFGTAAGDNAFGVAVDAAGVYVAGSTAGTLPGQASAGDSDAFVRSYDANGNERWTRQFGTANSDQAFSVAVDAAGIYVAGVTAGVLPGQTNAGGPNVFVRKYDTSVTEAWTRQLGGFNAVTDIARAVDAEGNVYVAGETNGILPGQPVSTAPQMFVRKYDAAGIELWTRQFSTFPFDRVNGIAVDASGLYVAGFVFATLPGQTSAGSKDAFLRKYDAAGGEVWTRQFGTSGEDQATGVAADASGVYITGFTTGAFAGFTNTGADDMFVRKYDAAGNAVWTNQFGSAGSDQALGVAVSVLGVSIAGNTTGALPTQTSAGGQDAFVRAYDLAGNALWTRQFGNFGTNGATGVATDSSGVYVAGLTAGALPGQTSAGNNDAYVRKYDAAGGVLWTSQFGTSGADQANGVSAGPRGVYVAGFVAGVLPGKTSAGGQDAFARKYDAAGAVIWTGQFGTAGTDSALGVNVGASGVYVAGSTTGTFPGQTSFGLEDIFVAKIVDVLSNTSPSNVVLNLSASVNENGIASLNGAFTDPDAADTHTVIVNWGAGEGTTTLNLAAGVTTFSATHTYQDDNPTGTSADVYAVSATVTEPAGNTATSSTNVTVNNVPPTITGLSATPNPVSENGTVTLTGALTDAGTQDAHTVVIAWGAAEGTTTLNLAAGVFTFSASHQYLDDNPGGTVADVYTISVTASDDDDGSVTATNSITLNNVAPEVTITGPSSGSVFTVGTPITFSGAFIDAGTADTHTAQWTFAGVTIAGTVTEGGGSGSVSNSYTFSAAGVYTVRLTVTDDDGASGIATNVSGLEALVVIYDPSAGFVTGGGWIDSPAGAYVADPALTGRANFGFVSKYHHGAAIPEGQTEFQLKAGNMNFHSTAYELLIVGGARAEYMGSGTINGAGNYGFRLTAMDGQLPGGGGQDKFRIQIWDKNNGNAILYDTQIGASDAADPTTVLRGGSIVIHSENLRAAAAPPLGQSSGRLLTDADLEPLLAAAGLRADASAFGGVDVGVADLDGAALGLTAGSTIWLDRNAAGWGWFVDPSPLDDSEFVAPGDQGEQNRMDLWTVLVHEMGHVLGHGHDDEGLMAETLTAGTRGACDVRTLAAVMAEWIWARDHTGRGANPGVWPHLQGDDFLPGDDPTVAVVNDDDGEKQIESCWQDWCFVDLDSADLDPITLARQPTSTSAL